jgi:hypothetical protein
MTAWMRQNYVGSSSWWENQYLKLLIADMGLDKQML